MSGDTAVPLPEPVDLDAVLDYPNLQPDQLRRVEALQVARQTLVSKAGLFGGSKVEANRAVYDLTYLADWIIDGSPDYDGDEDYPDAEDVAKAQKQGFVDGVKASATFLAAGGTDLDQLLANGEGFPPPSPGAWEPGPPSFPTAPDHDDASWRDLPPTGALAENDHT
jgi:hypothetical protein